MAASIYILGIIVFMPFCLAIVSNGLRKKHCDNFDNHNPRQQMTQLSGISARALAAQENAWEAAIIFIGAFFVAYLRQVPLEALNVAALIYLIARIGHAICYMMDLATLRSLIFGVGMFSSLYIAFMS